MAVGATSTFFLPWSLESYGTFGVVRVLPVGIDTLFMVAFLFYHRTREKCSRQKREWGAIRRIGKVLSMRLASHS
jgi:hypothetical protein